jgi:SOS-response transcriptional repressor LexA
VTDVEVGPNAYALKVKDTTMRPLFTENTILIIDPAFQPEDRDYVIVHIIGHKQAIFRQILFDGQNIYLKPLNTDFKTTILKGNHRMLGIIVQSRADFKK